MFKKKFTQKYDKINYNEITGGENKKMFTQPQFNNANKYSIHTIKTKNTKNGFSIQFYGNVARNFTQMGFTVYLNDSQNEIYP